MEGKLFTCWFKMIFIAHCSKLTGFKVLFMNVHASHVSLEIIKLAIANNIVLICLPPHTSSFLQPLDVGVFKNVKAKWRDLLNNY